MSGPPQPDNADDVADGGDGGDAACWLDRVCDRCGALVEGDPEAHVCRGAARSGGEGETSDRSG
jgi:hypothetical protein